METPETQEKGEFSKELLVIAPLLGSTLAVAFDVGYFYGIDVNFFTLFSITEHIVFALEALPSAFILTVFLTLFFASGADKRIANLSNRESPSGRTPLIIGLIGFAAVAAAVLIQIYLGFILLGAIAFGVAGVATPWLRTADIKRSTLLACVGAFVFLAAFASGADASRYYLRMGEAGHLLQFEKE
jgi:hypothetical protein